MTRKRDQDRKKESTPPGGMTYEEIGRRLGITKQGVRRIEKRAIRKIKRKLVRIYGLNVSKIRDYLIYDPEAEGDWDGKISKNYPR